MDYTLGGKSCPGRSKCGDWMHSVIIAIEDNYNLGKKYLNL